MKKSEIARRLWDIEQELKGLTDEKTTLREELTGKMKPGEIIPFVTPVGPYRAKLSETTTIVLDEPREILDTVGKSAFLQSVKVGIGDLREALKTVYPQRHADVFKKCVKAEVPGTCLKILKGIE